jgi:hypothetical protein
MKQQCRQATQTNEYGAAPSAATPSRKQYGRRKKQRQSKHKQNAASSARTSAATTTLAEGTPYQHIHTIIIVDLTAASQSKSINYQPTSKDPKKMQKQMSTL